MRPALPVTIGWLWLYQPFLLVGTFSFCSGGGASTAALHGRCCIGSYKASTLNSLFSQKLLLVFKKAFRLQSRQPQFQLPYKNYTTADPRWKQPRPSGTTVKLRPQQTTINSPVSINFTIVLIDLCLGIKSGLSDQYTNYAWPLNYLF